MPTDDKGLEEAGQWILNIRRPIGYCLSQRSWV